MTVANNDIYVVNTNSGTVSIIDHVTYNVIKTVSVGNTPIAITTLKHATNPLYDKVYVTNAVSGTVSMIDPSNNNAVSSPITVGAWPVSMTTANGKLYVSNASSGTVSVINGTTVEKTLTLA